MGLGQRISDYPFPCPGWWRARQDKLDYLKFLEGNIYFSTRKTYSKRITCDATSFEGCWRQEPGKFEFQLTTNFPCRSLSIKPNAMSGKCNFFGLSMFKMHYVYVELTRFDPWRKNISHNSTNLLTCSVPQLKDTEKNSNKGDNPHTSRFVSITIRILNVSTSTIYINSFEHIMQFYYMYICSFMFKPTKKILGYTLVYARIHAMYNLEWRHYPGNLLPVSPGIVSSSQLWSTYLSVSFSA